MDAFKQSQKPHPQPPGEDQALPADPSQTNEVPQDPVEDASADSFPASDPPSFTGSTATKDRQAEDR